MIEADIEEFEYDIFLCYNQNDEVRVAELAEVFRLAGLRSFFAPRNLHGYIGTPDWEDKIFEALRRSRHLGVYCSADTQLTDWVNREVNEFKSHSRGRVSARDHRILVIPDGGISPTDIDKLVNSNPTLAGVLRPRSAIEALQIVAEHRITSLVSLAEDVRTELKQTQAVARESFDYYRHARFWRPLAQAHNRLHVFTCGRDTVADPVRGSGGRSSIDVWDYRAAVDITHHFATHHRDVGVEIEQPISKTRIDAQTRAFDLTPFSSKLADANCVIIGSPDVSDFAEITLANVLRVAPYTPQARLNRGFKIIKDRDRFSTFYEAGVPEGVRLIGAKGTSEFANVDERTYGVMVLADNPFSYRGHKILILAGWSGVATRAMSLLLTVEKDWCLTEFFGLDQSIARMSGTIAAVIEVNYRREPDADGVGDNRVIPEVAGSIRFREAVEL